MTRTLTLLILLAVIVGGFLVIRNSSHLVKDSIDTENPATPTDFSHWREFTSKKENFKIIFPGLPQHATDKISDPWTGELRKYDTFVAADNEGPALMISVITFPKNIHAEADLEEKLKKVVNEMLLRNSDNRLKSMDMNGYRGAKSLDFAMTNGELIIKGKVFAHKNKLYILSMIGHQDMFNPAMLNYFINSFQILNENPKEQNRNRS